MHTISKPELAPLHKLSLLFVDDEEDIRRGTSRYLQRHFLAYHDAPNGQEGLEKFRQYRPDIVVTDVTMPVMDGLEMARRIKAEDESVPIVVISAHNEIEFFAEAIEIGIDSYILKPANMSTLLFMILKSAQPIIKQRIVDTQNKLIRHLLELSASPTLIASSSHPETANKAFLELLGCHSDVELYTQFEQSREALLTDSAIRQAEQFDCLEKARNDPDVLSRLLQSNAVKMGGYEVSQVDLPDIEKSVFTLKPKLN